MGAPKTFTESMLGLRKGLQHPPGVPTLRMLQGGPGGEVTWKRKEGSVLKGREKGGQSPEGPVNRPGCVIQERGAGKRPVLFKKEFSRESVQRLRRWGPAAPRGRDSPLQVENDIQQLPTCLLAHSPRLCTSTHLEGFQKSEHPLMPLSYRALRGLGCAGMTTSYILGIHSGHHPPPLLPCST